MKKTYRIVATFPSSSKSGLAYEVKEDESGKLSCNCKVWIFNQKGDRSCYHTMSILAKRNGNPQLAPINPSPTTETVHVHGLSSTGEPKRKIMLKEV